MLDQLAMWVGYAVMGAGALAAVGFGLGVAALAIAGAVAYYLHHPPQPGDSGREG